MWEVGLPTSVCAGIPSTSSPFPILNDNGGGKAGSSAPALTGGGGGGLYHLPHIQIVSDEQIRPSFVRLPVVRQWYNISNRSGCDEI